MTPRPATRPLTTAFLLITPTASLVEPDAVEEPVDDAPVEVRAVFVTEMLAGRTDDEPLNEMLTPVERLEAPEADAEPDPRVTGTSSTGPDSVMKVVVASPMTASVQSASPPSMPQLTERVWVTPSVSTSAFSEMMEGPSRRVTVRMDERQEWAERCDEGRWTGRYAPVTGTPRVSKVPERMYVVPSAPVPITLPSKPLSWKPTGKSDAVVSCDRTTV